MNTIYCVTQRKTTVGQKEILAQDSVIHLKQIKTLYFNHLRLKERGRRGMTPSVLHVSVAINHLLLHILSQAPH